MTLNPAPESVEYVEDSVEHSDEGLHEAADERAGVAVGIEGQLLGSAVNQ